MTSDPKRRRSSAYRKGFQDALARAIEIAERCNERKGDDAAAELPARLREISLEDGR